MLISVVICTHNPREVYLNRVLAALREQTLPGEDWELIIVDNASTKAVSSLGDLTWKSNARVVEEKALGLTNARLRGIAESVGEVIVFVDDDNVLAANYLAVAAKIADEHQKLGAWGGQCIGEFESAPPAELSIYFGNLVVTPFAGDSWGNDMRNLPPGAGMCIRRFVAEKYATNVVRDERRRQLDRIGVNLSSCGDTDLGLTSFDLGLGAGRFADLSLTHIIPAWRLDPTYLNRLVESSHYSLTMLNLIRGIKVKATPDSWKRSILNQLLAFYQRWLTEPAQRSYLKHMRKGEARARHDFDRSANQLAASKSSS